MSAYVQSRPNFCDTAGGHTHYGCPADRILPSGRRRLAIRCAGGKQTTRQQYGNPDMQIHRSSLCLAALVAVG
jgi:hypothetical protein